MSYSHPNMKRCVNDRHNVPSWYSTRTCYQCEDARELRIFTAFMTPLIIVFTVIIAVILYMAIGWWTAVIVLVSVFLVIHRREVMNTLDRFGGWVLHLMGVSDD